MGESRPLDGMRTVRTGSVFDACFRSTFGGMRVVGAGSVFDACFRWTRPLV